MFEPLLLTDMLPAIAAMIIAAAVGWQAGRLARRPAAASRLRMMLYGAAALVAARLVIAGLILTGRSPGPELRVGQGQLVEVTLVNVDVAEGVTVHWHGVDVPNAEDGVPGVTQEAVAPGGRHVYRFVPNRPGTFWYRTHRNSAETVKRGLFGALIVDGSHVDGSHQGVEKTVFTHLWPGGKDPIAAFDTADQPSRQAVTAGAPVLLRLINSAEEPHRLHVGGTPYTVTVIAGGILVASGHLIRDRGYRTYRRNVGRAILLGLEFLVAADIIKSVAIAPTFRSVGVLAVIVAVRTFLSVSLQAELTGRSAGRDGG